MIPLLDPNTPVQPMITPVPVVAAAAEEPVITHPVEEIAQRPQVTSPAMPEIKNQPVAASEPVASAIPPVTGVIPAPPITTEPIAGDEAVLTQDKKTTTVSSSPPTTLASELLELRQKLESAQVPDELKFQVEKDLNRLERTGENIGYDEKYERLSKYLDWVVNLPWDKKSPDILDIEKTKQIFDKHHYGMQEVKDRFLEYVAVLKMRSQTQKNPYVKAPILLLVGLVGTGKTTFAYSLAEALGRKIIRIPFGGMGSARDLRGQSRLHIEAEPGYVIKGLRQAGTRNPVILLDEIDRVAEEARNDIMGVLVELLDPGQNYAFTDHYVDYPFNLSECIFLATANNTRNIATAVFDRLEQISMPSYTDEQKTVIAQRYVLPQLLEEAGMTAQQFVIQDPALWQRMVRPLGYDAGIRTLQRTLQGAVRKAALEIIEKHVPQVIITDQNINQFLPQY